MPISPYQPDHSGQPGQHEQPGAAGRPRMPRALVAVLVLVVVHALGSGLGGWAVLEENENKREHGQELLMPTGMAWAVALISVGLAVLQIVCVVLARGRRLWVRAALAPCLALVALAMLFSLLSSMGSEEPSLAAFLLLVADVAALWVLLGETGRHWFSVPGTPRPPGPHGTAHSPVRGDHR